MLFSLLLIFELIQAPLVNFMLFFEHFEDLKIKTDLLPRGLFLP